MHKRPGLAVRLRLTKRKAALLDRLASRRAGPSRSRRQAEETRALAAQRRAEIKGTA
ncbi:hypothetical protein ACTWQF_09515 [Streptomyces sp. 8N114]|uniref:hypothetical protein n=1 Tax=Streptomyces sp. 8N114 TaxID=3457419 RepID=UPI003FD51B8B